MLFLCVQTTAMTCALSKTLPTEWQFVIPYSLGTALSSEMLTASDVLLRQGLPAV